YDVLPESHDFGEVPVTSSGEFSFTVINNGVEALTIRAVEFEDDSFRVSSGLPLTIPPGGAEQLPVSFTPRHAGQFASTYTILTDFIDPLPRSGSLTASAVEDLSALPGFAEWRDRYFDSPTDPRAGLLEDPNNNGLPNFIEFLYFLDPISAQDLTPHLPDIIAVEKATAVLSYTRASGLADALFQYQYSTDLVTWNEMHGGQIDVRSTVDLGDGSERVEVALPRGSGRRYFRILNGL
ncbi:MAG: hypothetical protein ACR2RV_03080, partial [Verrucomicrobiales bacterium]